MVLKAHPFPRFCMLMDSDFGKVASLGLIAKSPLFLIMLHVGSNSINLSTLKWSQDHQTTLYLASSLSANHSLLQLWPSLLTGLIVSLRHAHA